MPNNRPPSTLFGSALWGWIGASSLGAAEVARAATSSGLDLGLPLIAALLGLSIAVTGTLGGIVAGLASLAPPVRRGGRSLHFLIGLATGTGAALAAYWFGDPAPFGYDLPLRGDPIAFAVIGVILPALAVVVAHRWSLLSGGARIAVFGAIGAMGLAVTVVERVPAPIAHAEEGSGAQPNVLLVTIDGARADRYGPHPVDVPALHRLALEGVRFERAFAQSPATGPSHVTLMTASPPWEHGVLLDGVPLPEDRSTLAEALYAEGFETGAFVSSWMVHGGLGYRQGYRTFDDDFRWMKGLREVLPGRLFGMARGGRGGDAPVRRGEDTVERALSWIDAAPGPWLTWVHLADPQAPYTPPPPFDQRYYTRADPRDPTLRSMEQVCCVPRHVAGSLVGYTDLDYVLARYDGEVAYTDVQLGRLLDALDRSDQAANTLVIVVGTHGESLGEGGAWFRHEDLSDATLHVPLVMRWPGQLPAGHAVVDPVELTDVAPTVLALLGHDAPDGWSGVSLDAVIRGGDAPRALARAVAVDVEASRASGSTWRQSTVRNRSDRYVFREAADFGDAFGVTEQVLLDEDDSSRIPPPSPGGPSPSSEPGEGRGGAERALVRDMMGERARGLLAGTARSELTTPSVPAVDRRLLEACGATLAPTGVARVDDPVASGAEPPETRPDP